MPKPLTVITPTFQFNPTLAKEIGSVESVILLYLKDRAESGDKVDGQRWAKIDRNTLEKAFPCWEWPILNRTLIKLYSLNLIKEHGHEYVRPNEFNCSRLRAFEYIPDYYTTTVPEPEPEPIVEPDLTLIDTWFETGLESLKKQPVLAPMFLPKPKRLSPEDPIPSTVHRAMYRLCYRAETFEDEKLLTTKQRGRVASVLGELRDLHAVFSKLPQFEAWWSDNWRSMDRATKQYQAPRPEQVREHWLEAMKAGVKPEIEIEIEAPKSNVVDIYDAMKKRAEGRHK